MTVQTYKPQADELEIKKVLIWDRKTEGGFPGNILASTKD
jgi:predicted Rdx family selenoprotein